MSDPPPNPLFEDLPRDPSLADPLPPSPFDVLSRWLDEARAERPQRNPTAMALATVDESGRPSLRVVLCRGVDPETGSFVFYTNRQSRKGRDLESRPRAAATFHWDAWERQVRIEGDVSPIPDAESDAYFAGRPRPAQLSAWASDQSAPIASREALLEKLAAIEARFSGDRDVPRPPHWGGYRLTARRIELWVGSAGRAHDRALWARASRTWTVSRLQP